MANTKISDLTAATALAGTEELPVVQGGATVAATVAQVRAIPGTDTRVMFFDGANTPSGDAGLTFNKTTDTLSVGGSVITGYGSSGAPALNLVDGRGMYGANGALAFVNGNGVVYMISNASGHGLGVGSSGLIGFASTTAAGSNDSAIARKAAKIVENNDGTAGSYAGTAFCHGSQTVAQLPTAASAGKGALAYVTDATATTPRSTVAGGGANEVLVMSNATNWLIVA